ncbi:hypothetical protein KKA08_09150 [bacterium]|nr:hypothetical protein [bacterium]
MKTAVPLLNVVIIAIIFMGCTQEDITNVTWTDNQPPAVTLLLPAPVDTLRGLVDVQVEATDDNGVVLVEFYIDGAEVESQSSGENDIYTYTWNTEEATDGSHLIFVRAYDEAQNYGDTVPTLYFVDNENEIFQVSLLLPQVGDTLRGLVDIQAEVIYSHDIDRVEFYIDGELIDTQTTGYEDLYTYSWDTELNADGQHLIFVRAYDSMENHTDAVPILALVDNINENAPRTLRVPSEYLSIQQGVNAANEGDTVLVEPGIYYETIIFQGKRIWVKSEFGPQQTILDGLYQIKLAYFMGAEDTTSVLCGFMMRNSYNGILMESDCSPTIINCIVINMGYNGIIGAPINAHIINNTIFNCQYGMSIGGISTIRNNIVVQGSQIGLWNASGIFQYRPIADYNDIWDWDESYFGNGWIPGENDMYVNPLFEDTLSFRLSSNSPCRNAGDPNIQNPNGTQSDIGAWGGPHAYQ